MTAAVSLQALTVAYKEATVLQEISTSLPEGHLTAVIGPNGSGKSTLLRTMAGLLPYEGSLTLEGRELRRWKRRDLGLKVGLLPQRTIVSFPFAVCDLIDLGRLPHRQSFERRRRRDDDRIVEAARAVGVEALLFRPVTELSGGESQRVMIAMLLVQDPAVFLLDEPTSALDPCQAVRVLGLLRHLAREGKAVAITVHDVNSALGWADSIAALKDGRLLFHGTPSDLDGSILEEVYDTPFEAYRSEGGKTLWRALSLPS